MYDFGVKTPKSVDEVKTALGDSDDGQYLAGGQTLIPVLKQRLAMPSDLISLARVDGLSGIEAGGDSITIKAMTTHADVAANADIQSAIPALAKLAGGIGDPHVRNRGTMGGSVANNDPAADYPAAVLGLGATVVTTEREIEADNFFTGMFETALDEGELITEIRYPIPEAAGYIKFPNPATRYALVAVMAAKFGNTVRVAVTGAGPCVFRVPEMEQALTGNFSPDSVKDGMVPADDLNNDIHASRDYRAHLIGVLARRAVAEANG
ncbi:MAG: xanthine dehydrogenase family protein subunit M [Rhodospirillales bacterium]|nr:xanthine dehydrogenase family protein subunit M [Rhodospirillales bacterium]MBO6785468.1 xanthine dehydrogenase family protein subunit M [Rhodospirillales bacterium]